MKKKAASKRGHWTTGKRRNDDCVDWDETMKALEDFVVKEGAKGSISWGALAAAIEVDRSTVQRWRTRGFLPAPAVQAKVVSWLDEQREAVALAKAG